jgi:hypothetical protein
MTFVIRALPVLVVEFRMGEKFMKRAIITVSLVLVVGLSAGCNRAKDKVLPNGTKVFGERTLKDGTVKTDRIELADAGKQFDVTSTPKGEIIILSSAEPALSAKLTLFPPLFARLFILQHRKLPSAHSEFLRGGQS